MTRAAARTRSALVLLVLLVASVVAGAPVGAAGPPGAQPPAGTYRLPLDAAPDVARAFERPARRWAAGHRGVDLRSSPGAEVLSPVAGVVTFAGVVAGRPIVTVTDGQGRRSSVEPVAASIGVGDHVGPGTRLGSLVAQGSHCAPGTCLHWGVRVGADYVDPLSLLPGAGPVVLLPLDPDR